MSDYTPGPWVHIPNEKFRPGAVLVWTAKGPGHGTICELSGPNGYTETMARHEANARLIAAAPDLLAAAEDVLRSSHSGCACFECEQLAAAIKKAKGQQ